MDEKLQGLVRVLFELCADEVPADEIREVVEKALHRYDHYTHIHELYRMDLLDLEAGRIDSLL